MEYTAVMGPPFVMSDAKIQTLANKYLTLVNGRPATKEEVKDALANFSMDVVSLMSKGVTKVHEFHGEAEDVVAANKLMVAIFDKLTEIKNLNLKLSPGCQIAL